MKARSLFPLLAFLLNISLLVVIGYWSVGEWEDVESKLSELEALRDNCLRVQQQALFPAEARMRARLAQKDYLHHVVESLPLLRDEAARLEDLANDPLFSHLNAIQQQQKRLANNPSTLHFTARPAATGSAFRDRTFLLTHPTEVDMCDVTRLLSLIEGGDSPVSDSVTGRPLLFLTDFRLERRGQEGRWLLDLSLVEREWRGSSPPSS